MMLLQALGVISLQVKEGSNPYQAPLRHMAYTKQKTFNDELYKLQKEIIIPLGVDRMSEWCNSFSFIPQLNGKVRIYRDLARLRQALIRLMISGPTTNDVFLKLTHAHYLTLIDARSGYHNLKLDEISSYLKTFIYQTGIHRWTRLLFTCITGDMFQEKQMKILKKFLALQMMY